MLRLNLMQSKSREIYREYDGTIGAETRDGKRLDFHAGSADVGTHEIDSGSGEECGDIEHL